MRFTLTPILVVSLLAAGAGPAAGRPIDAAQSEAMRSLAGHRSLGAPLASASTASAPAPSGPIRVTHADSNFDWVDGGIGAGLATALLLSVAGVSAIRRHPTKMMPS
jgi:hypothetical protein